MYTKFIDRKPYLNLMRDASQQWPVLMEININILFLWWSF